MTSPSMESGEETDLREECSPCIFKSMYSADGKTEAFTNYIEAQFTVHRDVLNLLTQKSKTSYLIIFPPSNKPPRPIRQRQLCVFYLSTQPPSRPGSEPPLSRISRPKALTTSSNYSIHVWRYNAFPASASRITLLWTSSTTFKE